MLSSIESKPSLKKSLSELEIAEYVLMNCAHWECKSPQPNRDIAYCEVEIQRVLAGQLIMDEFKQTLQRGNSYSYPKFELPGLTPSLCPYLFGSMAPDQYFLPKPIHLSKAYIKRIMQLFEIDGKKEVRKQLMSLKLVQVDEAYNQISKLLLAQGCVLCEEKSFFLAQIIQAFIGSQYIQATAALIGGDEKQYCAITITAERLSEAAGFDIPQNLEKGRIGYSACGVKTKKIPCVMHYQDHHKHLKKQLIIQSHQETLERTASKITITSKAMENIVYFYAETIAKKHPVVVNCTDGIDRTGILMVALTMLYKFTQKDFTEQSEQEQKIFLISLIEQMKRARGPFFLRIEEDVVRAILLGYSFITIEKQWKYQFNMPSKYGRIHAVLNEEDTLAEKLIRLEALGKEEEVFGQKHINRLKELITKRMHVTEAFLNVNEEYVNVYTEQYKKVCKLKLTEGKQQYPIGEMPIQCYIDCINKGFDLLCNDKIWVGSREKGIYTLLKFHFLEETQKKEMKQELTQMNLQSAQELRLQLKALKVELTIAKTKDKKLFSLIKEIKNALPAATHPRSISRSFSRLRASHSSSDEVGLTGGSIETLSMSVSASGSPSSSPSVQKRSNSPSGEAMGLSLPLYRLSRESATQALTRLSERTEGEEEKKETRLSGREIKKPKGR